MWIEGALEDFGGIELLVIINHDVTSHENVTVFR
jgi:hypothetical protein